MKETTTYGIVVMMCIALTGCVPREQNDAHELGVHLQGLYKKWDNAGRPADYVITNEYIYVGHTTNQYYFFTNKIEAYGVLYQCRFAIRDPIRFEKPGVLAITDDRVLLWVGDDGKVIVNPDKRWTRD